MRVSKPVPAFKSILMCAAVLATAGAGWAVGAQFADWAPALSGRWTEGEFAAPRNSITKPIEVAELETSALESAHADSGTDAAAPDRSAVFAPDAAAPSFSRIVIDKSGVSRIDGDGTPGSQVLIKSEGRVIGAAVVGVDGHWVVALDRALSAGDHRLTSVVAGRGDVSPGAEVRVFIPPDFNGQDLVAYDRSAAASSDLPVWPVVRTPQAKAVAIADEATKEFTEIERRRDDGQELAQSDTAQSGSAAPSVNPVADGVDAVRTWLKDANEIYQREIADRLAQPTGRAAVAAGATPAEAARKIAKERERATRVWEDVEARAAAEAAERERAAAPDAERRAAIEAEMKAQRDRKAKEEADRKAAVAKQFEDNLKRLDEANRREAEREKAAAERKSAEAKPSDTPAAKDSTLADKTRKLFFEIDEGSVRDQPLPRKTAERDDGDDRSADAKDSQPKKLEFTIEPERKISTRVTGWRERTYDGDSGQKRRTCATVTRVKKGSKAQMYVVQDGETLWSLARRYYGSGMKYGKIYRANRNRMPSPHVVRPCQRIILPGRRIYAMLPGGNEVATAASLDNGGERQ